MAELRAPRRPIRLLVLLCALLTLTGMAAHFIGDAACRSPESPPAIPCGFGGQRNLTADGSVAVNNLHIGTATPAVFSIVLPAALCFVLATVYPYTRALFFSPPLQPPRVFSIA